MTTNEVDWVKLREPFGPDKIGKLPKGPKGTSGQGTRCGICGNKHPEQGYIHVDYVGHAHITERLNLYGGDWSMVPVGGPQYPDDEMVWMEVRLTIGGVTRSEVGCAEIKKEEWPKLLWSDCLTRAAMRHGIGLALWMKEPLPQDRERASRAVSQPAAAPAAPTVDPDVAALTELLQEDVAHLDMVGRDAWSTWKADHPKWWQTVEVLTAARDFVMGLLAPADLTPASDEDPDGTEPY